MLRSILLPLFLVVLALLPATRESRALGAEPLVIAHRGASADAPENTLAAFREAWRQGADGIEGDFHLTADGQIVCTHDETTERVAKTKLTVSTSTLAELQRLDVGAWFSPQFAGERMPTLTDVLATVPPGKLIYIEVKCGPEIVDPLAEVLSASSFPPEQVRIISFDADVVTAAKQRLPRYKAYWITSFKRDTATDRWTPEVDELIFQLGRSGADGLDCKAVPQVITPDFARAIQAAGYELHLWTINTYEAAALYLPLGVVSITTDRPGLLKQSLAQKPVVAPQPGR